MGFGFSSIERAIAYAAQKVVMEAKALTGRAAKLQGYEPAIEAVTTAVDPQAILIERAAFMALGLLAKASSDVGNIPANGGLLSVKADAGMIADFQNLYSYLSTHLLHAGVSSPSDSGQLTALPKAQ